MASHRFEITKVSEDGSVAHNEGFDLCDNPFIEGSPQYREWRYEWNYANRAVRYNNQRLALVK